MNETYSTKNKELCVIIQNGTEEMRKRAEKELCELNRPLVLKIASEYYRKNRLYDMDDLIQIGTIGMLNAAKRFDVNLRYEFTTYAVPYIRGSILNSISDDYYDMSSRIPRYLCYKLGNEQNEYPSDIDRISFRKVELDDEIFECSLNRLEQFNEYLKEEQLKCLKEDLFKLLDQLTERERKVLLCRYGLDDDCYSCSSSAVNAGRDYYMTLEEIGNLYGVGYQRIHAIEQKALRKLRRPHRAKILAAYFDLLDL